MKLLKVFTIYIHKTPYTHTMSDTDSISSSASKSSLESLGAGVVKDTTMKVYLSNGRTIARAIGYDEIPDNMGKWIHEKYDDVIAYVEGIENIQTRKNKIAALNFMAGIYDIDAKTKLRLAERMGSMIEQVKAKYATNEMTEKQKKNWVSSEDIDKKIKELGAKVLKPESITSHKEYSAMSRYLMLSLHKAIPVRNDLADAKIITDPKLATDDKVNYIIISNKKKKTAILKLNTYKTKDAHGVKEIEIPQDIVKDLIRFLPAIQKNSPAGWLFPSSKDSATNITRNAYTKMFGEIWKAEGKAVGTTQLRRTAVTELYKPVAGEYQAKAALANIMCHTPATASLCYAKVFSADGVEQAD